MNSEKNWYVVRSKEHCEKRVVESFLQRKFETFWPLVRTIKISGNRATSRPGWPLFERLVFVQAIESEIPVIKHTEGVDHILYWLNWYAVIHENDISTIKNFLELHQDVWYEKGSVKIDKTSRANPDGHLFRENEGKIFVPTLGCYLVTRLQPGSKRESLQHAI